jgi:hypothetical protein
MPAGPHRGNPGIVSGDLKPAAYLFTLSRDRPSKTPASPNAANTIVLGSGTGGLLPETVVLFREITVSGEFKQEYAMPNDVCAARFVGKLFQGLWPVLGLGFDWSVV